LSIGSNEIKWYCWRPKSRCHRTDAKRQTLQITYCPFTEPQKLLETPSPLARSSSFSASCSLRSF